MKIVELKEEHLSMVTALEKLCFSHPISEGNLKMLLPGGIGRGFIIIDEDRKVAAAYGGVIIAADEGQILNIATHPEYRRLGYGRRIMDTIVEYSRENGVSFITLEVRESNIPAISLYEGIGFYKVGRLKGYYNTPKEDGLILRLDLV
jgi:ribosomal-protein-alanine N-acetyltransferase